MIFKKDFIDNLFSKAAEVHRVCCQDAFLKSTAISAKQSNTLIQFKNCYLRRTICAAPVEKRKVIKKHWFIEEVKDLINISNEVYKVCNDFKGEPLKVIQELHEACILED